MIDFNTYSQMPKALSFDQMQEIHAQILEEVGTDDDALEIYGELQEAACDYAAHRAKWLLITREERMEIDEIRTACHNTVITKTNMLARYLRMIGKPAAWRDTLGYTEDDPSNRRQIGDFACYLVFVNCLNAR